MWSSQSTISFFTQLHMEKVLEAGSIKINGIPHKVKKGFIGTPCAWKLWIGLIDPKIKNPQHLLALVSLSPTWNPHKMTRPPGSLVGDTSPSRQQTNSSESRNTHGK
jgi:hypothetical protein